MYPNTHDVISLPGRPNLEQYKKRAKDLVKACRAGTPEAIATWAGQWPEHANQVQRFATRR